MQNSNIDFYKSDREKEKEIDNFATQTIEFVAEKGKMSIFSASQITNFSIIRKQY